MKYDAVNILLNPFSSIFNRNPGIKYLRWELENVFYHVLSMGSLPNLVSNSANGLRPHKVGNLIDT